MFKKELIEKKIEHRLDSIFESLGNIVLAFYKQLAIFLVGLLNASLISWEMGTELLAKGNPFWFALTIALITLIAVECLAVFLVASAARTGQTRLWVFSVCFATAMTIAHAVTMFGSGHTMVQFITLMIPFFIIVAYLAYNELRKIEEIEAAQQAQVQEDLERQRQAESERRRREEAKAEQERLVAAEREKFNQEMRAIREANKKELELAKISASKEVTIAKTTTQGPDAGDQVNAMNEARQIAKEERQQIVLDIVTDDPRVGPSKVLGQMKEMGYNVSLSTIKRDIKDLNGLVAK